MVSEATVSVTFSETPAAVKCMADEIVQQVQKTSGRHPFNELQMNDLDEEVGDKKCSLREETLPKEASSTTEAELFELELSEDDRRQVSPVVDSLICGITDDFFGGGPVPSSMSLLESFLGEQRRRPPSSVAPRNSWDSEHCLSKKGNSKTEATGKGNSEGLIRAEYTQPPSTHNATLAHMMAEKSSLKRELRSMDLEFEQREGRKPTKAEKEHLRPMYVRYWKLKHQIGKLQSLGCSLSVH